MNVKEIRQKGFELFNRTGRMPSELHIGKDNLSKLLAKKDANVQLTPEQCYYDDLLVVVDNSIKEFEVKYNND